jgi:hypothetical protein
MPRPDRRRASPPAASRRRAPILRSVLWTATIALLAAGPACGRAPKSPPSRKVLEVLARGAPFSESSFYACILNGYAQGLPLKQIEDECETKLLTDDQKGFGVGDIVGPFGHQTGSYDPASVTAACHSGDPRLAAGDLGHGRMVHQDHNDRSHSTDWGGYTWGGKGQCGADFCYKGLTEKESQDAKHQNIGDADDALADWKEKDADAKANPKDKAKADAAAAAKRVAEDKARKAMDDPNKAKKSPPAGGTPVAGGTATSGSGTSTGTGTGGTQTAGAGGTGTATGSGGTASRPVGPGESPCEEALQGARELLGECQRTGWKPVQCQSLLAKINGCPDPTLIYVDPDAGYTCGAKIDPEAVKNAWVAKCRELKRPVPGGPDPCAPPEVDGKGRYVHGDPGNLCGDPRAMVNPDSPDCMIAVKVGSFGPDINQILIWAMNKLGGPIVVLPATNPPPEPGTPRPEPRPGPTP